MPSDTAEIMDVVGEIGNDKGIRYTLQQAGKGAAIVSVISFAGALLFGPIGLAVGGAVGGGSAYMLTRGNFKSLREVLNGMSSKQRDDLAKEIKEKIGVWDNVAKIIRNSSNLQVAALTAVLGFIERVLKLEVYEGKR